MSPRANIFIRSKFWAPAIYLMEIAPFPNKNTKRNARKINLEYSKNFAD